MYIQLEGRVLQIKIDFAIFISVLGSVPGLFRLSEDRKHDVPGLKASIVNTYVVLNCGFKYGM